MSIFSRPFRFNDGYVDLERIVVLDGTFLCFNGSLVKSGVIEIFCWETGRTYTNSDIEKQGPLMAKSMDGTSDDKHYWGIELKDTRDVKVGQQYKFRYDSGPLKD